MARSENTGCTAPIELERLWLRLVLLAHDRSNESSKATWLDDIVCNEVIICMVRKLRTSTLNFADWREAGQGESNKAVGPRAVMGTVRPSETTSANTHESPRRGTLKKRCAMRGSVVSGLSRGSRTLYPLQQMSPPSAYVDFARCKCKCISYADADAVGQDSRITHVER